MFEAILCDMDGTLIDTEYANAIAYCEALNKYGVNIDVHEFIDRYLGMSWREFIPLICPLIDEDTATDIARDKKLIYKNKLSLTSVNLNVIQMIGILKARIQLRSATLVNIKQPMPFL
ncbi:haloacid dehalogenase-like hydrolase [Vibrio diazotrophicus]|uniref:Haloacid dehalogenase-like hydrolase n=1 Tax=Vibrio diazotrophicus TaxID=685 RepID=A0A329DMR5_VIBDI|nr:HAD hydrolase-like protein [Vibrio diazotrophicus]RAS50402.1 haloacid dehalogenase-like hydrolase [Vibrio diazotrophicus]